MHIHSFVADDDAKVEQEVITWLAGRGFRVIPGTSELAMLLEDPRVARSAQFRASRDDVARRMLTAIEQAPNHRIRFLEWAPAAGLTPLQLGAKLGGQSTSARKILGEDVYLPVGPQMPRRPDGLRDREWMLNNEAYVSG